MIQSIPVIGKTHDSEKCSLARGETNSNDKLLPAIG